MVVARIKDRRGRITKMPKIRHFAWVCKESEHDPKDYSYASDQAILELCQEDVLYEFDGYDLTNVHALMLKPDKQYTNEHLRMLVAARGFTETMCNWLEPDRIQDEGVRSRVAIIQHLLGEVWEKIDE